MRRLLGLLPGVLLVVLPACSGKRAPVRRTGPDTSGVVSLERLVTRTGPSASAPTSVVLVRGTRVRILESRDGFLRVALERGGEAWVAADGVERASDLEARQRRTASVASFPAQPGRAVEICPVLLAPDYGAARWGTLEDGDDVDVILADHDFFGVRLPGKVLAFVPARSIRFLPSAVGAPPQEAHAEARAPFPEITPLPHDEAPVAAAAPSPSATPGALPAPWREPLVSLPAGGEPPVLVTRVDARYPELARRMNLSGEVVLRVVVEANGSIGKIDVVNPAPGGMTAAAIEAVRSWVYRPARVDGRPVAVYKTVKVRFSLVPVREEPVD